MRDAGVQVVSWFSVACELMHDWRQAPGSIPTAQKWFSRFIPNYAALYHSWAAIAPQEDK